LETKSLDRWRFEIKSIGKKHWLTFYEEMLGQPCSVPMRLYRAINLYGDLIVMEAIVDSSNQMLTGDALGYVVKVASNKWKTIQQQEDEGTEYGESIDKAKASTLRRNQSLQRKLKGKRK
jgi:hypothetical protein